MREALAGAGSISFVLLVFLIYLPLTILIPSSSGLATLSIPIMAPLGKFAGVGGDLVVTAFQSASGLVNIITPTAAVVMGALALGHVPYDRWVKYVWKLMLYFLVLTLAFFDCRCGAWMRTGERGGSRAPLFWIQPLRSLRKNAKSGAFRRSASPI